MTVVITGAAGFIGSHLSDYYLNNGQRVIGIDDFTSSSRHSDHLNALRENNCFVLIDSSIEDPKTYERVINNIGQDDKITTLFNFACPASPPVYQAIPIKTMMTCVMGTKNGLDFAKKMGCKMIQASTSEVYGDPDHSPQQESYRGNVNVWGDRANYDVGKRAAETLCYEYIKLGVDARVVRIFNTYGENMYPDDGRVITNFVKQAITETDITIYGDGKQTRSFCYISDLVNAICKMESITKNLRMPINIGNPNEFTIKQLADIVIQLTGTSSKIKYEILPADDPKQRRPDITLAKQKLSWEPTTDLRTGLQRMITYMKTII